MAELDRFLRYLQREDVAELVLQTSKPATLRLRDGRLHPLTKQNLLAGHIVALLDGEGLRSLLPTQDGSGSPQQVEIAGRSYACRIARQGDQLQARFALVPAAAVAAPTPADEATGEIEKTPVFERTPSPRSPAAVAQPNVERPTPPARTPPSAASIPAVGDDPFLSREPKMTWNRGSAEQRALALLREARESGCSDVHLVGNMPARLRRLGELVPIGDPLPAAGVEQMLAFLLEQADARNREQLDELGYADFALELPDTGRLRVNFAKGRSGLKGCFRLLVDRPPTLHELGLPPELNKVATYHQGLAVVSGPSGQGKTTTMAALVDRVNASKPHHIITVEDPIEIVHPIKRAVISQRQVGLHTASFHRALKAALREDPDVIVIGELRDRETVEMALQAAETGHLVIASMSTPSGAKTIDRLIDMFPPEDQAQVRSTLAGALKMVISQKLVPNATRTRMVAASELITGSVPLWSLIRENKLFQLPSLLQRGRNYGMIRIEDSLDELVERGVVDLEVARAHAEDPRLVGRKQAAAAEAAQAAATANQNQSASALGAMRNLLGGRKREP